MSRLTIDIGTAGNSATGDSLRTAFTKVNTNFEELYAELGGDSLDAISFTNNTISTDITNANLILTGNGTGGVVIGDFIFSGNKISTASSNANIDLDPAGTGNLILKSGNFLPNTDNTQYLGSADKRWHTLYVGPGSININGVSITESGGKISLGTSTSISGTLEVNEITSADSSAIQINDGVNISGNVHLQGNTITLGNITESSIDQSLTTIYGAFGLYDHSGNYSMAMSMSVPGYAGGGGQMIFEGNNSSGYALVPSNNNQYTLGRPEVAGPGTGGYWKNLYTYAINFPDETEQTTAARFTVTGDDSTSNPITAGQQLFILGGTNISTAVVGSTVTINGPDLSSYATTTYVDNKVGENNTLIIKDDTSTSISINLDNTLEVLGSTGISTSVSGSTLTITGPDLSSYLTAVPKTIDVNEISSSDSSAIQINDAVNISGALTANVINIGNASEINFDGGTGNNFWKPTIVDGTGTINKAGVYKAANNSNNSLFTFGANGAGVMSVIMDGSLFVGSTLPSNNGGLNTDYGGWLVVQAGGKFGGDLDTLGRVYLNGNQFEDDSGVLDFFSVSAGNHIVTCHSDWTLKLKARANAANQGNLWLEAGQNTKIKVKGNGSTIDLLASDGTTSATWTFAKTGTITFPDSTTQSTAAKITVVGDDSTGVTLNAGETIKIAGTQNITTAVSGDTLTITGPDLSSYVTENTNVTFNVLKIDDGVHEKFQAKADATGVVTHDCASGHIFYHTSPDADWTANFTNLNLSSGYATAVTLVIVQGGTGYYPSAVQIGGAAQTLNWQGNATPTPSSNRTDVVTFSIINNSGTYTVLGQLTGF